MPSPPLHSCHTLDSGEPTHLSLWDDSPESSTAKSTEKVERRRGQMVMPNRSRIHNPFALVFAATFCDYFSAAGRIANREGNTPTMNFIPPESVLINLAVLSICFYALAKSAGFLVDGAVGIAVRLDIPKMIIGIVLVGFGTTTPEFVVSIISALKGQPEIALGNASGSVIANSVALALGILMAPAVIRVPASMLKTTGMFLLFIDFVAFGMCLNGTLGRTEGVALVALLVAYITALVVSEKRRKTRDDKRIDAEAGKEVEGHVKPGSTAAQLGRFLIGLVGVLFASRFLVECAINIATCFNVPKVIIGMTIVAIGTSLPEIATCVVAAKKGHGELAFGDIIGADILNVLWIAGGAAIASPMSLGHKEVMFMFPSMIVMVVITLGLSAQGFRLQKWKGWVLIATFVIYLFTLLALFPPTPRTTVPPEEIQSSAICYLASDPEGV